MYREGAALRAYLNSERTQFVAALGKLGLLRT
jgi:hypothetical protein